MRTGLIGKKIGTTSLFEENGSMIPVTMVKIEDCIVSQIKTTDKHGYNAVQLASIDKKTKIDKVKKPQRKLFSSISAEPKQILKEFRVASDKLLEIGTQINVSHFEKGQVVDVTGTTIGKGFAGAMKRHNFAGLRASHGESISHRAHGSTGQCQDPGKVFKGKKMAGQLGNKRVTTQNVSIVSIDSDEGLILIKGSIPGSKGGFVYIKDAIKSKLPEGLPYPAGLLESNNTPESKKDNDVTKEEDKIVSDNITNKENNDQSLSIDQNSEDQISKTDNLNENKDK